MLKNRFEVCFGKLDLCVEYLTINYSSKKVFGDVNFREEISSLHNFPVKLFSKVQASVAQIFSITIFERANFQEKKKLWESFLWRNNAFQNEAFIEHTLPTKNSQAQMYTIN